MKKIYVMLIAFFGLVMIALGLILQFNNKASFSPTFDANTFFLKNKEGLYAMFDVEGNRITDFIYDHASEFVSSSAVVSKDYEYGLISSTGKMVVDFGVYDYISSESIYFYVYDADNNQYLLDEKGKKIMSFGKDDVDVDSYDSNDFVIDKTDVYEIYSSLGKKIISLKKKGDSSIELERDSNSNVTDLVTFYYNNQNYVVDVDKGKILIEFDANEHYCIDDHDKENNRLILSSCDNSASSSIMVFKDYKLIYSKPFSECSSLRFTGDSAICDLNILLDENGNVVLSSLEGIAYYDSSSYAKRVGGFNSSVEFYVDNKLVNTIQNHNLSLFGEGKQLYDIYLLYDKNTNLYKFYNRDGSQLNGVGYKYADHFMYGNAEVSEDGTNYYMINTKGEKVTDNYAEISVWIDYDFNDNKLTYKAKDFDGNYILLHDSQEIFKGNRFIDQNDYIIIINDDDTYTLYSLKDRKNIATLPSRMLLYKHYFGYESGTKSYYYSYVNGQLFYEK